MSYFVYVLYSTEHDKFYKGQTNCLSDRIHRHNSGRVKSTAPYRPWKLVWKGEKTTRSEAVILEYKLKNLCKERTWAFLKKYS